MLLSQIEQQNNHHYAHRAVCVDVHQCSALVVGQLGEGNAKLGGSDGQPTLAPAVLRMTIKTAAAAAAIRIQLAPNLVW
jgi:hypothetical protein